MYARIEVAEDRDAIGDAELLRYFRRGDQSALDVLMERHRDALFRFCYHLTGNREDAEDVCQETLARAMTRVQTLQSDSAFRSWLFSIARNLSIDTHRRKKRTTAMPDDEAMPIQLFTETPQDRVEVAEERQTVAEAMGKLAQSHQRVLVLREVEGMSYAAIAEQLDVSQSAVETLLFRARRRLKEEYHKSAAPALALIAGLRELILKAGGPVAGGAMAKLAMTAAMVGSVALTLPQSYHFPQVPSSATSRSHTGSSLTHGSAGSRSHGSTSSYSTGAVVPPSAFKPAAGVESSIASSLAVRSPRYVVSSTSSSPAHRTASRKPAARSRKLQKHIPALPSGSNTVSGTSRVPPPPPSNSVVPIKAAPAAPAAPVVPSAPAPTASAHVKWVPAAVQKTSAPAAPPVPTAQPTTAPAPQSTSAPLPTSAPVPASAPGNSGRHGRAGKEVPVNAQAPAVSAPVVEQQDVVTQTQTQPQSAAVQPYVAPSTGTTTGPGATSGKVPPGQAKKDGAPSSSKPGRGPHK